MSDLSRTYTIQFEYEVDEGLDAADVLHRLMTAVADTVQAFPGVTIMGMN